MIRGNNIAVYSKALDRTIEVGRVIGAVEGKEPGPVVVITGGIHGNEPSGVFALDKVMKRIRKDKIPVQGKFYAISGNHAALGKQKRYMEYDLNRMWTVDRVEALGKTLYGNAKVTTKDEWEQLALHREISSILDNNVGPFYFLDLHSTSSETNPFVLINDTIINRTYASQFPAPLILGIEEFIDGPLLNYINHIGYVAIGFESGQHDSLASIEIHEAFVWLSLVFAGCINRKDLKDFKHFYNVLERTSTDHARVFEILHREGVSPEDKFIMNPGFVNFQKVNRHEFLAQTRNGLIYAEESGRIFMPLYQEQGEEGFFIIREIAPMWLRLSKVLRKMKFENLLPILPGIRKHPEKKATLVVNTRIARFLATEFFHLLGYRRILKKEKHLEFTKREFDVRGAQ